MNLFFSIFCFTAEAVKVLKKSHIVIFEFRSCLFYKFIINSYYTIKAVYRFYAFFLYNNTAYMFISIECELNSTDIPWLL